MRRGMEAGTLAAGEESFADRIRDTARQRPALVAMAILAAAVLAMVVAKGLHDVAQTGLDGPLAAARSTRSAPSG